MKSFRNRILFSFALLIGIVLAGLGLIIGQLFPVYVEDSLRTIGVNSQTEMQKVIQEQQINLTEQEQNALFETLPTTMGPKSLSALRMKLWIILVSVLTIAFLIAYAICYRMVKNFSQPIDNVTETALELAHGNYRARAFENSDSATLQLSNSINILARNLQDIMIVREMEQERLKTLIENMGSALLMIGREGHISVVNRVFLQQFDYQFDEVFGKVFRSLGLPKNLENFVNQVFMTEKPDRKQIEVAIQQEIHHVEMYGAPVVGEHGLWLGVVIVMHDITDLKRLEQVRKDFVANVSHELRTPITSIKGFSETLLDGAYNDSKMLLSFLEIIHTESNRLQILVQDLLELSKIEQDGFSVEMAEMNLRDVLLRAIEMTYLRLEEKDMSLNVEIERNVMVQGDTNRLIQVFMNLISNAINYSPEHTTLSIRLSETASQGIVEIKDEGIGIEKDEIPRIFERFYRVNKDRSRNSGGTGLGLAIVKHLIEVHHGKIVVESELGKGTTFRVFLPKKQPN